MNLSKLIRSGALAAAGLALLAPLASTPAFAQNSRTVSVTISGGGNMTRQQVRNETFFVARRLCSDEYGNSRPAQMLGITTTPIPGGNRFYSAEWRCS
ncbi:hypothetical protein [Acidovorax sp. SUPP3334]|uniref:hypothetical protein n=1 Tax=Acidovorax sp. SUPP3334 TaxID=2920881 RepID=UPI0023DE5292|nr:hypothetical protein [Acidovorax sp. SUPP3334]GKT24755.1 hypothetical protein AVHM3334_15760 [Acidovorax sp. SUPP3334]